MAIDVEKMYKTYGPMVLRRCRQLLGTEDRAVDAMQTVFVTLARSHDEVTERYPACLLHRMVTDVALGVIRSERRCSGIKHGVEVLKRLAMADEAAQQGDWCIEVARLFGSEPVSSKHLAVLHFVDGLTLREVAREVGMPAYAVRRRLRMLRTRIPGLPRINERARTA